MNNSKVLAIIPARSGSKRIPHKNIKTFNGKPLIQWTIDAALDAPCISKIVVTSDDSQVLQMSSLYPNIEFIKRPDNLSTDNASSSDVILHAMSAQKQNYDSLLLLQPTSPLRTSQHIQSAVSLFQSQNLKQLVSACRPTPQSNHLILRKGNGVELTDHPAPDRDLWALNGAIYLSLWNYFLETKSFITLHTQIFEMDATCSVDIDTLEDWNEAINLMQKGKF